MWSYKLQTCPLVRESALHEEASNCQTKENSKFGHRSQRGPDAKRNWWTDRRSQNFELTPVKGNVCHTSLSIFSSSE
jgi:hypothetical protein